MTKKQKPAKKAKKPVNKTPEITKAAKALENYLKENNLDPSKDWSKDKKHGKAVKELMAKLTKERDKVAEKYPEQDKANQAKLVKLKKGGDKKKKEKSEETKEKKPRASSKYDYPLVDGREMTSEEKKKYRMAQRKLANGKTPKEEKPKKEVKSKEEKSVKKTDTKTKKVKKSKKVED